MRFTFVGVVVLMAAVAVLLPGSALSNVNLDVATSGALEFDSRVGTVAPTKAQRRHVKRLKASVTWSQFGTPSTLVRHGKALARGVRGKNPADAAGWYLNRHKALFGIRSLDALAFVSANRLGDSKGWAVTYRQVFDGLTNERERHRHGRRRRESGPRLADRLGLLEPHSGTAHSPAPRGCPPPLPGRPPRSGPD